MQSDARASHLVSRRNSSRALVEKYFTPVSGGWPSGFNIPSDIRIVIS